MIGRSALAYVPANLANILTSFGLIIVLTRLFTGAEFGIYALAMITTQFTHMGLLTWLEAAMARFQARAEREADINSHLKTLYGAAAVTAIVGLVLIMGTIYLIPVSNIMKTVLVFALGSTCIQVFFNLGMEAHKAAHRIGRYSAIYTTQTVLSFFFGISLILLTDLRAEAPYIGIIIALLIGLCIDLPFMLKRMKGGVFQVPKLKTYFGYGMPICVSLILTYTLNSADMYLIAGFMGPEAAGQYNAGYNLANRTLEIVFVWLSMAITPIAMTALEKQGLEDSRRVMKDYGAALLWITLPAATGIALVAKNAGFILGESVRAEAVTIMPLIAFAGVFNGLITYYAHRAFMFSGRTGMFVIAMVPPVIVNIGLNLLWIPAYGLMGAVYATVCAYVLGLVISIALGRRYYPLPLPVKATVQIIAACAAMAAVVLLAPIPGTWSDVVQLLVKAAIGGVVYGAASVSLNTANCRTLIMDITGLLRSPKILEAAE